MVNTNYRINEPELMDDFGMQGALLEKALDKIASINKLLGGNQVTRNGVGKLLAEVPASRSVSIADMGCGNGDMLRYLADYGKKNRLKLRLTGIDANAHTIKHARSLSRQYDEIKFDCADFYKEAPDERYDIILLTLTLHHFTDEEILVLLNRLKKQANIGIVVNDLHRSKTAYYLFRSLCTILQLNEMTRADGLTSILRGFKKRELEQIAEKLGLQKSSIKWKWAYRYQWIISNL